MHGRQIALGIAFLVMGRLDTLSAAPDRPWLDGELLSRKTVAVGRPYLRNEYVYRVRGFNCQYVVVSKTPLNVDLYVPIRFSRNRGQMLIQDADGHESTTHILQRAESSRHR